MAKKSLKWPKIDFLKVAPHFFRVHPYSNAKTDFFYFVYLALQCREHGVPQNVPLPKTGAFWPKI